MKIAILGSPRTGTNKLQRILSRMYDVPLDYSRPELLTGLSKEQKEKEIEKLNDTDSTVVRLFVYQFNNTDVLTINWEKFDFVFGTYRDSLVDGFVSLSIGKQRNKWVRHKNEVVDTGEYSLNVEDIEVWYNKHVANFNKLITRIEQVNPVITLSYDEICNNDIIIPKLSAITGKVCTTSCLPDDILPTGINYKEQCLNYTEVENKFKELGLYE